MRSPYLSCEKINKSKIVCSKKCRALAEYQTFLKIQSTSSESFDGITTLPYFFRYMHGNNAFFDPFKDQFFLALLNLKHDCQSYFFLLFLLLYIM